MSLLFQLLLIAIMEKGKWWFKNWFCKNLHQLLFWVCPENVLGQDHASPQKGKHAQLCPVWHIICKRLSFDEAQEIPLWRETFQVRTVQQVLRPTSTSQDTSAYTHWSKAIQVRTVQQVLQPQWISQDASAHTHWSKEIQVWSLRKVICKKWTPEDAHAHPRPGETI